MDDRTGDLIKAFLKDQICLIVEPSSAFSSSLQACLSSLGMVPGSVMIARKYNEARKLIEIHKPKLLITEYEIESHFGLSLVEFHCQFYDDTSKVSMIVTRNSSDSVVAEAAEEQVDAFLLKPFSPENFRQKLISVLERKANPSTYLLKIKEGKDLNSQKKYQEAIQAFQAAKSLTEAPTLACFYIGQIHHQQGDAARALKEYREGRKYQNLHYKCLTAEFEALMSLKLYDDAWKLVELLKDNYPLTPRRLSQIFIVSIYTRHFEEQESYYDLVLRLDQRSPELVKVAAMAFFTSGKHFIKAHNIQRAKDLFDKSLLVSGKDVVYLEKILHELISAGSKEAAEEFLAKAPPKIIGTPVYARLSFKVDQLILPAHELVEKGRKLISEGNGDSEIFEAVVRLLAQAGRVTSAESVISKAVQDNPDLREPLYKILETNTPKKESASKAN